MATQILNQEEVNGLTIKECIDKKGLPFTQLETKSKELILFIYGCSIQELRGFASILNNMADEAELQQKAPFDVSTLQ